MQTFRLHRRPGKQDQLEVPLRGRALLAHPMYNKGTAFTMEERRAFGLEGMLPDRTSSSEVQKKRTYQAIVRKSDAIERYIGLAALQDRNEVLFYQLLEDHLDEFLPIVYTPTVGQACKKYSHIFRRGRGLWITPRDRGRVDEILANAPYEDARLIVVTDNERILGLGDLGAGGMGIPIGKLALYTVAAGIHPSQCLPISLDVGTDNEELLNDEFYVGFRERRLRGEAYDELVEEFVEAVRARFPKALLQWEDFKKANAFRLLDRYADRLLSFNDDIQGTAAVTLAGVMAGCRIVGQSAREQRVLILGGGAAGIGIARQLREWLRRDGVEGEDLTRAIAVLDSRGLLIDDGKLSDEYKKEFAWRPEDARAIGIDPEGERDLAAVVRALKPTVLLGTSGQPGIFTEDIIRDMQAGTKRPIILPISNPTANTEARPEDLIQWTKGRALVATGSPFDAVEYEGKTHEIAQGNNVYIFPGVGLGALAVEAHRITDRLFTVAAESLAECISEDDLARGRLYPPMSGLRDITRHIAIAVGRACIDEGLADSDRSAVEKRVDEMMWQAEYPEYVPI
ncbi:NAD-dependent malic enzyme [Natronospira bacteriovora]|uniref:NAD-dependent malic enzyme n=1 Tax=Natronospira bacteriovora TaxID=3069753 RepID=A0ABU0WA32_9GAMM|nr:NAD-dependent malic enzyme [Natronospira sp. AB-CW4]MDQ2070300.1 NAD-dependent malic enzyme [Natronospira sp. AB-CW4]